MIQECVYKDVHSSIVSKKIKPNPKRQIFDCIKSNISTELNVLHIKNETDGYGWLRKNIHDLKFNEKAGCEPYIHVMYLIE